MKKGWKSLAVLLALAIGTIGVGYSALANEAEGDEKVKLEKSDQTEEKESTTVTVTPDSNTASTKTEFEETESKTDFIKKYVKMGKSTSSSTARSASAASTRPEIYMKTSDTFAKVPFGKVMIQLRNKGECEVVIKDGSQYIGADGETGTSLEDVSANPIKITK